MVVPDLIVRTYRRSLSLTISRKGELIVRAPKKLTNEKIFEFINDKEKWINRKKKEILSQLEQNSSLIDYNQIMLFGSTYKIFSVAGIKKIELNNNKILTPIFADKFDMINKVAKWYIEIAKDVIAKRVEYFADLMQIEYNSFSITNSKSRWGSCDSSANIKLNFRVVMLPHKIIDYIIIHELSHILEFNHSKEFYKVIETLLPDWQLHKKNLKNYNYLLQLFR